VKYIKLLVNVLIISYFRSLIFSQHLANNYHPLRWALGFKWSMLSLRIILLPINLKEKIMSKGQDSKKTDKKKPAKTMKEKRNDKKDKKANK